MKLIITGCEHVGRTTLGEGVSRWIAKAMGSSRSFHDHFTIPTPELTDQDAAHFMAMSPAFKERFQRYQIDYHTHSAFLSDADHMLIGYHIEEAVFAPLYYGYGGEGEYAERTSFARHIEQNLMVAAPDFILVLLKASPEAIRRRMRDDPQPRDQRGRRPGLLQDKDVEYVLRRFEEEYRRSLIRTKFEIDNSDLSVEETLAEFVSKVQKYLSQSDRLRILSHQALMAAGDAKEGMVAHIKTREEQPKWRTAT